MMVSEETAKRIADSLERLAGMLAPRRIDPGFDWTSDVGICCHVCVRPIGQVGEGYSCPRLNCPTTARITA